MKIHNFIFKNKPLRFVYYFLIFIFLIIIWGKSGLVVQNYSLSSTPLSEDKAYFLDFPGTGESSYTYKATVTRNYSFQKSLKFFPDDCISEIYINNVKVDLSNLPYDSTGLCNYTSGIDLNLEKYLHMGQNTMEVRLIDYGGSIALKVLSSNLDSSYFAAGIFILIFLIYIFYQLSNYYKISKINKVILILGLTLYYCYFFNTPWFIRGHDVHGHIPFIEYLVTNLSLPDPTECWECHQQPLYYILLGIFTKILSFADITDKMFVYKSISLISLTFFSGYLFTGVRILEKFIENKILSYISVFLFIFWPANILHSFRIGNDQLTYLFIALSMYYAVQYSISGGKMSFYISLILSVFTSFIKLTAFAIVPIPLILLVYNSFKKSDLKSILLKIKSNYLEILLVITFLLISLLLLFNYPLRHGFSGDWLTINKPGDTMLVQNNFINFVYIDIPLFIKTTNINTFNQASGTEYFLHTLLKTSLFGEFQIKNDTNLILGDLMSLALLIFLATLSWNILQLKIETPNSKTGVNILFFGLLFASLVYFRYKMPYTPNQDFRYVLPILLPSIYACITIYSKESRKLSNNLMIGSLLFINFLAILFFVNVILTNY